jgi:hypothetical protein
MPSHQLRKRRLAEIKPRFRFTQLPGAPADAEPSGRAGTDSRATQTCPSPACDPVHEQAAMNRIRRICRWLARLAGPAGIVELRAAQLTGPPPPRARRSGRDGLGGGFIQDVAAAANVAVGHQLGRPAHGSGPAAVGRWPATTTTASRGTMTAPGLLPRTVQLCTCCRQNPAGFWVSRTGGQTVRRPWCLSCCQGLDRDRCDVTPFDS